MIPDNFTAAACRSAAAIWRADGNPVHASFAPTLEQWSLNAEARAADPQRDLFANHKEPSVTDFIDFPKMARLSREIIVTEKIDGTNAQVCIGEDGSIRAGSRTRWIVPGDDNFGFAAWVEAHRDELLLLGPGRHFGEWWGSGIQRRYGMTERRFSLFNVSRWASERPTCCDVVPTLYRGDFDTAAIEGVLARLRQNGSVAAPGFMNPEGIVVFHTAGNVGFKKTLEKDEQPKSLAA